VITLAGRPFTGPFLAPIWSAPRSAGVFAVMVPGWRVMTFRALHFDHAAEISLEAIRGHARYAEWVSIAGTEWNLYIAVHEMSFSTEAQRGAVERALARDYRPEFNDLQPHPERQAQAPSLRTLLLAQAMRESKHD
jgi:hypothetical protein